MIFDHIILQWNAAFSFKDHTYICVKIISHLKKVSDKPTIFIFSSNYMLLSCNDFVALKLFHDIVILVWKLISIMIKHNSSHYFTVNLICKILQSTSDTIHPPLQLQPDHLVILVLANRFHMVGAIHLLTEDCLSPACVLKGPRWSCVSVSENQSDLSHASLSFRSKLPPDVFRWSWHQNSDMTVTPFCSDSDSSQTWLSLSVPLCVCIIGINIFDTPAGNLWQISQIKPTSNVHGWNQNADVPVLMPRGGTTWINIVKENVIQ